MAPSGANELDPNEFSFVLYLGDCGSSSGRDQVEQSHSSEVDTCFRGRSYVSYRWFECGDGAMNVWMR